MYPGSACSEPLALKPHHGSGYVPASLNWVFQGIPFLAPSQNRRKFGFVVATPQEFDIVRSVADPPKSMRPCGNLALKLNSRPLYHCFKLGSFVSTYATAF